MQLYAMANSQSPCSLPVGLRFKVYVYGSSSWGLGSIHILRV